MKLNLYFQTKKTSQLIEVKQISQSNCRLQNLQMKSFEECVRAKQVDLDNNIK